MEGSTTPVGDFKFTPVDVPLSAEAAQKFDEFLAVADLADNTPGNGKLDLDSSVKAPKLKLGFITLGGNTIPVHITLDVTE